MLRGKSSMPCAEDLNAQLLLAARGNFVTNPSYTLVTNFPKVLQKFGRVGVEHLFKKK